MNSFEKIPAPAKILLLFLVMAFVAFGKRDEQSESEIKQKEQLKLKSVSFTNGKYKVDSIVLWRFDTKKHFLETLNADSLSELKTTEEIPAFIRAFLDSISPNGKFNIANPGEPFYIEDITNYGKQKSKIDLSQLPDKQLICFAIGKHIALISFYCGGLGEVQNITLIKFTHEKITDLWYEKTSPYILSKTEIIKHLNKKVQRGC